MLTVKVVIFAGMGGGGVDSRSFLQGWVLTVGHFCSMGVGCVDSRSFLWVGGVLTGHFCMYGYWGGC